MVDESAERASTGSRTASCAFPAALAESAWLCILTVAPLAMNPLATRIFESSKLTAVAPLAALLLAALLASLAGRTLVRAAGLRAPVLALGGFFGVAVLATLASDAPWIAWNGNYLRSEGLAAWLVVGLVGAGLLALLRSIDQARRVIDALLLGSVVPCLYALLQRYGYVSGPGAADGLGVPVFRPGATLGNPVFLGDYLMLVIPLGVARVLMLTGWPPRHPRAAAPWLALLALQAWVLLLTQSRGPLLALLAALWLFVMLLAGLRGSRALLLGAGAALPLVGLALAALNLVPALAEHARGLPGLQRFVLAAGMDASSASRLGIWDTGVQALLAAPWPRLLIGDGFDAAYLHYFAHVPPQVMQIEGQMETTDRLHNDCLELLAGVGILGLLAYAMFVGASLRGAAAALGARGRGMAWWCDALAPALGALLGAALLAGVTRQVSLAPVGLGAGAAAGWALLLLWRVAAGAPRVGRADREPLAAHHILVAALAATLLGFWLAAEVGVPVMATRLVFFAEAALLAVLAAGACADSEDPATPAARRLPGWLAGVTLVVAVVAFIPAPLGAVVVVTALTSAWAKALLLLAPALAAWWAFRATGDGAANAGAARDFLRELLKCAVPFVLGTLAWSGLFALIGPADQDLRQSAPVLWAWAWLACSCLAYALTAVPGAGPASAPVARTRRGKRAPTSMQAAPARRSGWRPALRTAVLAATLASLTLAWAWPVLRADVLLRLAARALVEGRADDAAADLERAIALRPRESQYLLIAGTGRLERTLAALQAARGTDARQLGPLADELRRAEAQLRAGLALAPADPWMVFGLANVLQIEGMTAMRPLIGAGEGAQEGPAKAAEARRLYAQAHAMFPAQATILRNWAQIEFDSGDPALAYRLLDQMEVLMPQSEEPFVERLRMARHARDDALAETTLARAAARLGPQAAARIAAAAPAEQG